MKSLRYPSKEFSSDWPKAIHNEIDFEVDAKLGGFRKNSFKCWIDATFLKKAPFRRSAVFGIMCSQLTSCIAQAFVAKKYDVHYSETQTGLLITFHVVK